MFTLLQNVMTYFSHHIILANLAHALGGFGLAVVLQHHTKDNSFLPVWIGWWMVNFSVVVYIKALI